MDTKSRKLTNRTAVDSQNQIEPISQEIYRQIVTDILSILANTPDVNPHIQTITVFDCQHDRYQLLRMGWTDSHKRIFNPILHLDIIEGKVWIQENRTDIDIGEELSSRGIPKFDIVLGLHPPHLRPYNSEYSIT